MIRILFILLLIEVGTNVSFAQCSYYYPIELTNPGFEGNPAANITPVPWATCGITPDTQPGSWGVMLPASEGNTYLGMVQGGSSWQEGASQELITPLIAGQQYGMSLDLSATDATGGGIDPNNFGLLEIWGSNSICNKNELLWSSPLITHLGWQSYDVTFIPTENFEFIYFINAGEPLGYLLMDNIRSIEPSGFILEVNTGDSSEASCTMPITGTVDQLQVDSIVIQGEFTNSPLTLLVSAPTWSDNLLFESSGYEGVSITAYGHDSINNPLVCAQMGLTFQVHGPIADFGYFGVCENQEFVFEDQSIPYETNTIISWSWTFDALGTSSEINPSVVFDTSGLFEVNLLIESSDGCLEDTSFLVEVLASPDADFSFTEVCLGHSTNFHDLSNEGVGSLNSWSWDFGDGNTTLQQNPVYTYLDTGEFNVQLIIIDNNGCSDTITQGVEVFLCASINEHELKNDISIYPNPVTDRIVIDSKVSISDIRLLDEMGRLIHLSNPQDGNMNIVLSNQSSGIYFLELESQSGKCFRYRILKQ